MPTEPPTSPIEAAQPTQETALHIDITPPVAQRKKVTHFEATGFDPQDTVGIAFLIPSGTGGMPNFYDAGNVTADETGKASYDLTFDGTGINDTPGRWLVTFGSPRTRKSIQRGFELVYADDATLQSAQATAQAAVQADPITITPATVTKYRSEIQLETSIFKAGEALEIYVITPEGLYDALPSKYTTVSAPLKMNYALSLVWRPVTPGTWRVRIVSKTSGKVAEGTFTVTPEAFATPVK